MPPASLAHARRASRSPIRGGVMIVALIIAAVLGVGLVSYLQLSRTALKLSTRTIFINDADNLADLGLEEAIYCFGQMTSGVAATTAWSGWTFTGVTAKRTLPSFNRDQNGVGVVKVWVSCYDGSDTGPTVISQATITPFDGGAPIVRVHKITMQQGGVFINGVVGLAGLSLKGQPVIDSFNSNPTNSAIGPWLTYSSLIAHSNSTVVVKTGTIDLGNGSVMGDVKLGSGVTAPPASQVSGTITSNYAGVFKMPTYPTASSVSQSYTLGTTLPATLPVAGHVPASDGRYYYFVNGTNISNTSITAGKSVVIVGTSSTLTSGITINPGATAAIFIDGVVNAGSSGSLNNTSWAGALQIFTTTTTDCTISGNGELRASFYAPYANLKASGGGSAGSVVGSYIAKTITATGQMSFHYDEALKYLNIVGGQRWSVASWSEIRLGSDLSSLSTTTGGFLP
jgi:hypothetical protein